MALIDSHAHLDSADYAADRAEVVARARAAGVAHVVLIGQWNGAQGGLAATRATLELAASDPPFFSATVGVHPHDAAQASDADFAALRALCAAPGVVAVGECGLDYHYDLSPRPAQRERFAEQIALAAALAKPVVVHTREADADTADLLRAGLGPAGGVIHCFTGDWSAARRYLDLGLFISLSGVLTFKNAVALREAAAQIPLDRLLVETDAPFLAPIPHRGKRNEPAWVAHTAACLAGLRGLSVEAVEVATTANARRALRLPG
ncbi:MAG: TatD family hydrolase [Myxococcales bacterium]